VLLACKFSSQDGLGDIARLQIVGIMYECRDTAERYITCDYFFKIFIANSKRAQWTGSYF
jgi:hypothetical protein